jgi:Family of unknown function (DUF7002)
MTPAEFANRFPLVYHMAETGTWSSIRRHGLLSTSALLSLFGYDDHRRCAIEARHRPECVTIHHDVYGEATIRDQKPMNEARLAGCLTGGLSPSDWYMILNARVFFWSSEDRLFKLLNAKAYRDRSHDVIIVDSSKLAEKCFDSLELSRINSGATIRKAAQRGPDTFTPAHQCPLHQGIAEVAVRGVVPAMAETTVRVLSMQGGTVLKTIWERLEGDGTADG